MPRHVWHRSKKTPLTTLVRHLKDTRNSRTKLLGQVPIQKLVSRANGHVTYRIYDEADRGSDAYTNIRISEIPAHSDCASAEAHTSWPARYMLMGSIESPQKIYQKLKPRALVHLPHYFKAFIVYQLDRLPTAPLEKRWTEIYYVDRSKSYEYTADKCWFMPLRTTWIIPKGESTLHYRYIGIDHLRQVIHDPDVVDITYLLKGGKLIFKAKHQVEITIVRDLKPEPGS